MWGTFPSVRLRVTNYQPVHFWQVFILIRCSSIFPKTRQADVNITKPLGDPPPSANSLHKLLSLQHTIPDRPTRMPTVYQICQK